MDRVSSRLQFKFITYVHIQSITFSGCLDTEVKSVDKFIIENSTFLAASPLVYYGRALVVTSSTVIVITSHFISFKADKQNGGAIYTSKCNVFIFHSKFMDNSAQNGGALYCLNSNTCIKNSSFTGNSAQNSRVLYNKQKAAEATNSTLHEYLIHTSASNMELLLRSSIAYWKVNLY